VQPTPPGYRRCEGTGAEGGCRPGVHAASGADVAVRCGHAPGHVLDHETEGPDDKEAIEGRDPVAGSPSY
jgi:hypothetical protein